MLIVAVDVMAQNLLSTCSVLDVLGVSRHEAQHKLTRFRRHTLSLFVRMHPYHQDRAKALTRQGLQEREEQLTRERDSADRRHGRWVD